MKKTLFMMMAACAIGFTSCGNKAQAPADAVEEAQAIEFNAEEEAQASITALTEQIEAQDASKLQEVLDAVQEKVKEILAVNPEVAKEYVTKVQDFLKENAEKIKAFAGDNEVVQTAVSALTAAPAESIVSGLMQAIEGVKATGEEAVDAAADGAKKALGL